MSENTQKDAVSGQRLSRNVIATMLQKNFDKLPEIDRKVFTYGSLYLGANAGLIGLVANSLYRRALNVRQARFSSSLPMAVLPFIGTLTLYNASVSAPLLFGDLECPTCVWMRGALIGVIGGGVYPILLALPVNIGLSSMYSTSPMPEKGAALRHWVDLSKPILKKMRGLMVIQALFGTYLSTRDFKTYTKLVEITFASERETLED